MLRFNCMESILFNKHIHLDGLSASLRSGLWKLTNSYYSCHYWFHKETLKIQFWYLGRPFDEIYSGKCTAKNYKEYITFMWNNSPKLTYNTFTNDIESISEVNSPWNISERFCLKRIPWQHLPLLFKASWVRHFYRKYPSPRLRCVPFMR